MNGATFVVFCVLIAVAVVAYVLHARQSRTLVETRTTRAPTLLDDVAAAADDGVPVDEAKVDAAAAALAEAVADGRVRAEVTDIVGVVQPVSARDMDAPGMCDSLKDCIGVVGGMLEEVAIAVVVDQVRQRLATRALRFALGPKLYSKLTATRLKSVAGAAAASVVSASATSTGTQLATKATVREVTKAATRAVAKKAVTTVAARRAVQMAVGGFVKLAAKLSATLVKSVSKVLGGPIGVVVFLFDMSVLFVDMIDISGESRRLSPSDIAERSRGAEAFDYLHTTLRGGDWPPELPVELFFGEELVAAFDDTVSAFFSRMVADVLNQPSREPREATFARLLMERIAWGATDDEFAELCTELGGAFDPASFDAELATRVQSAMTRDAAFRDRLLYSFFRQRVRQTIKRDWALALAAPFWYFALSIPASFSAGLVDEVPSRSPGGRGLPYTNATVDDIRISSERSQNGERFIEIYRAKLPYFEERVRAYRVEEADLAGAVLADLPEMPDMDAVRLRTVEHIRYSANIAFWERPHETIEHEQFGHRGEAHARWLALTVFQYFLIELSKHPGVCVRTATGCAEKAGCGARTRDECAPGGVWRRGVFRFRRGGTTRYYAAPVPRPWHEERFVDLDVQRSSAHKLGLHVTAAAVDRWNEVHANIFSAGSAIADLLDLEQFAAPRVAVWSRSYPVFDLGGAYPLDATVLGNSSQLRRFELRDGRVYLFLHGLTRRVPALRLADAAQAQAVASCLGLEQPVPSGRTVRVDGEDASALDASSLHRIEVGGEVFLFSNANLVAMNAWLPPKSAVLPTESALAGVRLLGAGECRARVLSTSVSADAGAQPVMLELTLHEKALDVRFVDELPYTGDASTRIAPGEDQPLAVGMVHVLDETGAPRHFLNFDGTVDPSWVPMATTEQLPYPVATRYSCVEAYQACNSGMLNDASLYNVDDTFAIDYTGGSPVVAGGSFRVRDSVLHPNEGGIWAWNQDQRTCRVTDHDGMAHFCGSYRGMDYSRDEEKCVLSFWQSLTEMLIGTSLMRTIRRL